MEDRSQIRLEFVDNFIINDMTIPIYVVGNRRQFPLRLKPFLDKKLFHKCHLAGLSIIIAAFVSLICTEEKVLHYKALKELILNGKKSSVLNCVEHLWIRAAQLLLTIITIIFKINCF